MSFETARAIHSRATTIARVSSHDRHPREHPRVTGLKGRKVGVKPTFGSKGPRRVEAKSGNARAQCEDTERDDGFRWDGQRRDARDEGAVRRDEERSPGRQVGGDAPGQAPGAAHPG